MPSIPNAHVLGQLVRRERVAQSLTQAKLAELSGVSRDWLIRFENDASGQELSKVISVLKVLGLALTTEPLPRQAKDPVLESLFEGLRRDHRGNI